MSKRILILEDDHERAQEMISELFKPGDTVAWTVNPLDCITRVYTSDWEEIWLDHDMDIADDGRHVDPSKQVGGQGMLVVQQLVFLAQQTTWDSFNHDAAVRAKDRLRYTRVFIHSTNDVKGPIMVEALKNAGYTVILKPWEHRNDIQPD